MAVVMIAEAIICALAVWAAVFRMFPLSYLWRPGGRVERFAILVLCLIENGEGWDGARHSSGVSVSNSLFASAVTLDGKQVEIGWYYKALVAQAWARKAARELRAGVAQFNAKVGAGL